MRKVTYILLLLLPIFVDAQVNHVPNGDFEYFDPCPNNLGQVPRCIGWIQPLIATPDFFHTCNTANNLSVIPQNFAGYQYPASGNGYFGGYVYIPANRTYREFFSREIIPLVYGETYEISLYVSLANNSTIASDNIGVFFYDSLGQISAADWLNIQPQVSFQSKGVITDTGSNWVYLVDTFVADSAYGNIAIGGFYDTSDVTSINVNNNSSALYSYYYFDSIVVRSINDIIIQSIPHTNLCTNDTFGVELVTARRFDSNNVFTAQLSDDNGNFNNPINIGSNANDSSCMITCVVPGNTSTGQGYKVRVISSNSADTSSPYYLELHIGNINGDSVMTSYNSPVCESDSLHLTATSNNNLLSYAWSGPNSFYSFSGDTSIANVTTSAAGTYYLTAKLYGCTLFDTLQTQITTIVKPTATSNTPICKYSTLSLQASSSTSGVSYSWSGPNGFNSNQQNPTISNAPTNASGNYYVTATVNGCSRMDTIQVAVNDAPDSVLLSSNTPVCIGDTLRLSADTSSGNASYSWIGPYSFSSTDQNPKVNANIILQTGWYIMTASIGNCSYTDSIYAVVKTTPSPPLLSYNGPVCIGDTLDLNATSNFTNVTYSWVGPNGFTSSQQYPKLGNAGLNNSGVYTGITTLNGCSDSATLFVNINKAPTAINMSSNSPLCTTDTLMLFADTTANTHQWEGPNGFTAYNLDTFIANSTLNHTGWYALTLDSSNGCSRTDSIYITVNPTPVTPTITYTSPICNGETLSLSALGNSSSFYSWTGANSFNASGKTTTRANLQLADSGTYTVTATQNGCTASSSAHISINPTPFVNILSTDSICSGETVTFSALPSNAGTNPQYNWFVNAQKVASGQTYTTTSLNNNDVVYCEMTDNTKCSSPYTDQSNTVTMTVLPWLAPSVTITSNPAGLLQPWQYVTFTANPVNAGNSPQYQWKRNGQDIVGATGNTWSANNLNDNDSISVALVSDYKCPQPATAMSNGIVVSVAVGVDDVNALNNISLIPNPNNGQFLLKGNIAKNGIAKITIINTLGQIVHQTETNITDQTINKRINLNDVASGLYLLRLDINGQKANIKFRVE